MGKATELKNTTDIVKHLLINEPATRNSDDLLYLKVCESINIVAVNVPFKEMLLKRREWGIPPFESVRRSRQKIQEKYPELSGNTSVEGHRKLNEEVFKEYARSSV